MSWTAEVAHEVLTGVEILKGYGARISCGLRGKSGNGRNSGNSSGRHCAEGGTGGRGRMILEVTVEDCKPEGSPYRAS